MGKTRLVSEFLKHGRLQPLVGACVPVAGEALPFAPLAQALRRLSATPARRELEAFPDLVRLLSPEEAGDTELGALHQLGFFQSVLGLLGALGREHPVVHVVEDIHWADRSTLDLVRFLATNLVDEHALIVLTYRVDQVTRTSTVRSWLAELGRLPRVELVRLQRLDGDDTLRLVEALAGPGLDPGLARTIVARSDGNPLFAQHLVWHSGSAGPSGPSQAGEVGMPIALSDLLAARLAGLPESTQSVVAAASVLARRASLALLAATSGLPIETVEDAVVPALERHVLRLTDDDRVAFHHPAFREIAYHGLLPTRRARLHRAAAEALEAGSDIARGGERARMTAGEVARHWHLAGDLRKALDSALAAAFAAERIYAFADAQADFLRVLDLLDRVDSDVDRLEILRHAARATRVIGDHDKAVRLLETALETDIPDRVRAAVLEELAYIHATRGHGPATEAALRAARALVPAGERSVLAAKIGAGLAAHAASYSRIAQAQQEGDAALELSREVGARQEEGRACNALGIVAAAQGRYDVAASRLRAALLIAREVATPDAVCDAYINLAHVLGEAGRHEEVIELARVGVEELNRLGVMRQTGTILLANAAESSFRLGRYDESDALVGRALGYGPRGMVAAPTLCRAAQLAMVRGEFDAALAHCDRIHAIVAVERAPASWVREVAEISAQVQLWAGHAEAAYELVAAAFEAIGDSDEQRHSTWLYALGLRALGDLADTRRNESARRDQRRLLDELTALAGALPPADALAPLDGREPAGGGRPTGERDPVDAAAGDRSPADQPALAGWSATAAAELARAVGRSDPRLWAGAEREWRALKRPLETAYAAWRHAESLLAGGPDADGIQALRAAGMHARRYGIVPVVEEVDRLARWYRLEDLVTLSDTDSPAAAGAVPATGAPSAGLDLAGEYGLTPREVEVLRSLTQGRTNHEIGDVLGISAKTASVHVSNILRKLDVTGRAEAARIGHRLGIDSDDPDPDPHTDSHSRTDSGPDTGPDTDTDPARARGHAAAPGAPDRPAPPPQRRSPALTAVPHVT